MRNAMPFDYRRQLGEFTTLTVRPSQPGDHCIYHLHEWCQMCYACRQGFKTQDHKCKLEVME